MIGIGRPRGQDLLDLLRPRELQQDGGAFYRGAAFEVVPCCPYAGTAVRCRGVEVAEVDDCDFEWR